jgi:hypothetical protein
LVLQFSYKVIAARIRVFDEGVIDFVDEWGRPSGILKENGLILDHASVHPRLSSGKYGGKIAGVSSTCHRYQSSKVSLAIRDDDNLPITVVLRINRPKFLRVGAAHSIVSLG